MSFFNKINDVLCFYVSNKYIIEETTKSSCGNYIFTFVNHKVRVATEYELN